MSDYTPTTEEVRRAVTSFNEHFDHPRAAEFDGDLFDRWLAEVKAQAWEEGFREALVYGYAGRLDAPNPYRQGEEQ